MLITHRSSVLGVTSKLLLLRNGEAEMFGPTAKVLAELTTAQQKAAARPVGPTRTVAAQAVARSDRPAEPGERQ